DTAARRALQCGECPAAAAAVGRFPARRDGSLTKTQMLQAVIMDVDGTMYRQGPVRRAMLWRILSAHAMSPLRGISTLRMLSAYRLAQEELRGRCFTGAPARHQIDLACDRVGQQESAMT